MSVRSRRTRPHERLRLRVSFLAVLCTLATAAPLASADNATVGCGSWNTLLEAGDPVQGTNHAMIYDSSRDRLVTFGADNVFSGGPGTTVNALNLTGTPAWSDITPVDYGPGSPQTGTAVYDAARDRMIVFSDGSPNAFPDAWALSFATGAWVHIVASGTPPPIRSGYALVYDPGRNRVVIFGGEDTDLGGWTNVAYALSLSGTPAWTTLSPSGTKPSARWGGTAIYDSPRDRLIVFGGITGSGEPSNEMWALSFAGSGSWSHLTPAGTPPAPRVRQTTTFDAPRNRLILIGGNTNDDPSGYNGDLDDVWSLSLTGTIQWTRLAPTGARFPATSAHATIYDSSRQRMVSFGGSGATLDQVWALPMTGTLAWSQVVPGSQPPLRRHSAVFVNDAPRGRAIVHGGVSRLGGALNDVWSVPLTGTPVWTRLLPTGGPPARRYACGAIDSLNNRLIIFGGNDGQHDQNETWALSLSGSPAWTKLSPTGTPPSPRRYAAAIYDPGRQRIVVQGGTDSTGNGLTDTWALSLTGGGAWTELTPASDPFPAGWNYPVGGRLAAVFDAPRDRMLVLIGLTQPYGDPALWELSFAGSGTWKRLRPTPISNNAYTAGAPWLVLDAAHNRVLAASGGWGVAAIPLTGTPSWDVIAMATPLTLERQDSVSVIFDPAAQRVVTFGGSGGGSSLPPIASTLREMTFPAGLHSLNFAADPLPGGTVTVDSDWTCFSTGSVVTLTATAEPGFQFNGWSGTASGNANPLVLTVNSDQQVSAQFTQPPPAIDSWRRLLLHDGAFPDYIGWSVTYDAVHQRLLATGIPPDGALGLVLEVWEMSLSTADDWHLLASTLLTEPVYYPLLAYDPVRDRLLRNGGLFASVPDEIWALPLSGPPVWTSIAPGGVMGPHFDATLTYDPVRDRLVLFGGAVSRDYLAPTLNDTWVLSLAGTPAWGRIALQGGLPPTRQRHTAAYDASRDRILVYGGYDGQNTIYHDVWSLSLTDSFPSRWTNVMTDGEGPISGDAAASVYDSVRDRLIVFGGNSVVYPTSISDSVFVLNFKYPYEPVWSRVVPNGTLPGPRYRHGAFYDATTDRMVFSGGEVGVGVGSLQAGQDTYALSLGGGYWLDAAANVPAMGSITRSPAADAYAASTVVQLTAVPASGRMFVKWQGDATGSANPLSVTMDGNKTIVAVFRGVTGVGQPELAAITELAAPAPNPGAAPMHLALSLARTGPARLAVFDVAGREVADIARGTFSPGRHSIAWDGTSAGTKLGPGLYFIRLETPDRTITRRFVLLK